jgi:hypothetical protein
MASSEQPAPIVEQRECGSCTACCDGWLKIVVYGHQVDRSRPCPFSTGHSCRIYEQRPQQPCREFFCGWLAKESPLPDWMRPDKAGLIMLPANFSWHGHRVDVAVSVGDGPQDKALEWLKAFGASHHRLLIYQIGEDWYAFGPPAFQTDMQARIKRGERLWE